MPPLERWWVRLGIWTRAGRLVWQPTAALREGCGLARARPPLRALMARAVGLGLVLCIMPAGLAAPMRSSGASSANAATSAAQSPPATAESTLPTAAWPTGTVLELLRLDAQRALDQAQGGTGGSAVLRASPVPAGPPPAVVDRIEVAAIYGTAGRLTAVVYINGRRKEYRPGASLPVGSASARGEYRLVRIADGCVWLAAGARQRSACYEAGALPTSAFGREPPVLAVEPPGHVALAQPRVHPLR